jgi:hypothetical protein
LSQTLKAILQVLFVNFEIEYLRRLIAQTMGAHDVKASALFDDLYGVFALAREQQALYDDVLSNGTRSIPNEIVPKSDGELTAAAALVRQNVPETFNFRNDLVDEIEHRLIESLQGAQLVGQWKVLVGTGSTVLFRIYN